MTQTTDTLPPPIVVTQAVAYATDIVAELGRDFVYHQSPGPKGTSGCWYVSADKPSCLIARILHRHGVPIETLRLWEGMNAADMGPNGSTISLRRQPTRHLFDFSALVFVDSLQRAQDLQTRYGVALDRALIKAGFAVGLTA